MKKDQVIEAARELFHQFGFKKVSMDEIAAKAGVTKKTIYMYFSSKEELLKYFIQEEILNMEKLVEDIEAKNLDSLKMIDNKIQNYIRRKLEFAKEKGYIDYKDLDVTTFLIYKMYIALIIEWNGQNEDLDEQTVAQSISEILRKGLRKDVE